MTEPTTPALGEISDFEPGLRVWPATELEGPRELSWLARHRIPRAALTLLVGDEGIGKSLLWVWLTAAVTTGRALPGFQMPARTPGRVLLVLTEDDWSTTVLPRLTVAGTDLERVSVICAERDGSGSPVFPRDMHLVTGEDADLVVVDAFLDTVAPNLSMKDPQQARLALHPWKEAAASTGAAVLLLTHTNRVDSRNARDRYGITGELRKKARSTLYAQQDQDGQLVVGPEKSNIAKLVRASLFGITSVDHFEPTEDSDGTVALLEYRGESDMTARDQLQANHEADHGADPDERTGVEAWLEDYLTENPGSASKTVKAAARAALGCSDATLKRAMKALRVTVESAGFPRVTTWTLPAQPTAHVSGSEPTEPTGTNWPPLGKTPATTPEPTGPQSAHSLQSAQLAHPKCDDPTGGPTCANCGLPLPATALNEGYATHPGCEATA